MTIRPREIFRHHEGLGLHQRLVCKDCARHASGRGGLSWQSAAGPPGLTFPKGNHQNGLNLHISAYVSVSGVRPDHAATPVDSCTSP